MSELPEGLDPAQYEPISSHQLPEVEAPLAAQPMQQDREAGMHERMQNQRGVPVPEGYVSHDQHFRHQMGWTADPREGTPGAVEPTGDVEIPSPVTDTPAVEAPEDAKLEIETPEAKPEAVTDVIYFLASHESRHINGAEIRVDNSSTIQMPYL